jgi:hypothetical protein
MSKNLYTAFRTVKISQLLSERELNDPAQKVPPLKDISVFLCVAILH